MTLVRLVFNSLYTTSLYACFDAITFGIFVQRWYDASSNRRVIKQLQQLVCPLQRMDESYLNNGKVWMNWPSPVGYCCWREKTGASVVRPLGLQKPLVVQSVKGQGIPSSRIKAKMLWYYTSTTHQHVSGITICLNAVFTCTHELRARQVTDSRLMSQPMLLTKQYRTAGTIPL